MKIAIIHNNQTLSLKLMSQLTQLCAEVGITVVTTEPDIVITIGGDGTLLSAFHQYEHSLDKVRFVGIHTGHLGFYTDWRDYELPELIESLRHDKGESVAYPLLKVTVTDANSQNETTWLSLNESTLKRFTGTMVADVFIRTDKFESFRGDGLCVSTPTGSTAYNKAVGGAVLHPSLSAIQLSEIASINNRVFRTLSAPMVLAPDEWIEIFPAEADDYVLTIDQLTKTHLPIKKIRYEIAQEKIHFARYRHTPFWRRVADAFIGEEDKHEI